MLPSLHSLSAPLPRASVPALQGFISRRLLMQSPCSSSATITLTPRHLILAAAAEHPLELLLECSEHHLTGTHCSSSANTAEECWRSTRSPAALPTAPSSCARCLASPKPTKQMQCWLQLYSAHSAPPSHSADASVITCKLPTGIYYLLYLGSFQRKRHLIICVCVYIYLHDIFHSEHFTEYE